MPRVRRALPTVVVFCALCAAGSFAPLQAQGLIWSLPEDGAWTLYEGTYTYIERREQTAVETIEPWTKHLLIQSTGRKMGSFRGEMVPCRWIEIEATTGRVSEEGLDPGPLGTWKYKVLVPEPAVVGELQDAQGIPVSMLPIVEGYRKFGDGPVQRIKSGALQTYPVLSLLAHYRQWDGPPAALEDPGVKLGAVQARQYSATLTVESPRFRSTNRAQLWRSAEVPFGLAKWKATLLREEKDSIQPRSEFQPVSEIVEEMQVHKTGTDAEPFPDFPAN